MFVFFVHNGIDATTYFPSSRLWIDRASLEFDCRLDRRAPVPRRSGLLEKSASKFLDGLARTIGSVVAIHPQRRGPNLGSLTSSLSILSVMIVFPSL